MTTTWRVTDRATFTAFRQAARAGRRVRRGELSVSWVADGRVPPRVAFAIGRDVGGAVRRNRIRRQLREIARSSARTGRLPAGAWLISARAGVAGADSATLEAWWGEAVETLRAAG